MKKTMVSFLCLVLLTLCAEAAEHQKVPEKKQITIIGTIVGCSRSVFSFCSGMNRIVVRVDRVIANKEDENYIMVVSSALLTNTVLPEDVYHDKSTWTFILERDPEQDTIVEELGEPQLPHTYWFDANETLSPRTKLPGYKLVAMKRNPKKELDKTINYYQIPFIPIRIQLW